MIPKSLKLPSFVRPLLKKTLDSDILKENRPVSNLPFISKVIENVISGRLNEYLIKNAIACSIRCSQRTVMNILQ